MARVIALFPTQIKQYTGKVGTYPYTTYGFLPATDPTELVAVSDEPDRVFIPAEGVKVFRTSEEHGGVVMVTAPSDQSGWYDNEVIDDRGYVTDTRLGTTRKRHPEDELVYLEREDWP